MEKHLTIRQAWRDFFEYIREPKRWQGLTASQRRRIEDAERDYNETRENKYGLVLRLGADRVKKILTEHAPHRYEFTDGVILHA